MKQTPPPLDQKVIPWLLISALSSTLPHFFYLPYWLSLFSTCLLLWSGWSWSRHRVPTRRWLLILLVTSGCSGILLEYHSLFGREAGVATLVIGMTLKLLELKTRRDAIVVVTLGYFLLLTHYFHAQNIPTGLWMLLTLWLLTATLVRLHAGASSRPGPTLRYAALLCLQSLPFMLVLYLLFPRIPGPLWGLPQDAHSGKTGLSDSMSPGSIAHLVQSAEIAFRVRFDGTPPPKHKLYWRGPVFEQFDGTTWRLHRSRPLSEPVIGHSPAIEYETTLEAHGQRWLLALDAPDKTPPQTSQDDRLTLSSSEPLNQRRRFRLSANLEYRFKPNETQRVRQLNLMLPANRNPRSLALARQWQSENPAPEAIIKKAIALFSSPAFTYTLQAPLLGNNGIDDFLFTTQRGFCEHYAAAFVVLMRAAGIPARVVGGYQGGEFNPVDSYLIVRQSDAHAWAEVWLENQGWLRVDPTSVVAPARLESGINAALDSGEPLPALIRAEWLRSVRYRWEAINNVWNQYILGYDSFRQRELFSRFGFPDADWRTLGMALATTGSVLLCALVAWALYRPTGGDPAQRLWHKALRQLARSKVDCAPWETPYMLAARVDRQRPELSAPFRQVVDAYLQTRYGPTENLQPLREAIARLPKRRFI